MQVKSESWLLPGGTSFRKTCHTVSRCRKLAFPYDLDLSKSPDILEVRCNIEVHEIIPQEEAPSGAIDSNYSHRSVISSSFSNSFVNEMTPPAEGISSSFLSMYMESDTEFKFSRISDHHIEIHFDFTNHEKVEERCFQSPSLNVFVPNVKESVCYVL